MIDLADYEDGRPCRHYKRKLARLQRRLERVLAAYIVQGRRAVVMLEGWDAAGKDGVIQRMAALWAQAHYEVYPIGAPSPEEAAHDFLWRFETRLPAPGNIVVFDRSWYGRVLVERVEALAPETVWRASYDRINAFEAKLAADGVRLVKLFLHITQEEQDRRLRARLDDPWKRWKTGRNDFKNRSFRAGYLEAMAEMFARTDRPDARWHVIDGNDKKAARIRALKVVVKALEDGVDLAPPALDPEIAALAEQALGWREDAD